MPGWPPRPSGGKYGAAVERREVRSEEHVQRPAAAETQRLHRGHVDAIDVGTLLAVDLDRHEAFVEHARDALVLERLLLHDVAPVAGGVADAEEDRPVGRAGERECLFVPGLPVDGIVRVLER
jgi:hypothetical protein